MSNSKKEILSSILETIRKVDSEVDLCFTSLEDELGPTYTRDEDYGFYTLQTSLDITIRRLREDLKKESGD